MQALKDLGDVTPFQGPLPRSLIPPVHRKGRRLPSERAFPRLFNLERLVFIL